MNVIASATAHKSTNIMLAALKFFLGQDLAAEQDDDTANKKTDEPEDSAAPPTKNEVYRTYHKVRVRCVCCFSRNDVRFAAVG